MLEIILMILKAVGLLLLGVLGLFFALVFLVMFVPIPYRVWVSGDTDDMKQLAYRVKVFGIQVFPKKERKKRKEKRRRGTKTLEVLQDEKEGPTDDGAESVSGLQSSASQAQEPLQTHRQSSKNKEKNVAGRDVRGMLRRLHAEFTDTGNRRAVGHAFSQIRYLIRHFGPRRVRADVSFSIGDPANTGYVTAALSICPFVYGKDCHILPDFEAEQLYLRGWMDVRGHIRMVHVLISGVRLLFDKDIQRIIRKILKKK